MNKKLRKKSGFTIIELLVVISMLLLLSGFIVPKIMGYQEKVKKMKAIHTGRQIYTVAMSNFIEGGNRYTEGAITTSVNEILGIQITKVSLKSDEGRAVQLEYKSDNKPYVLSITPTNNGYTIKNSNSKGDGDEIFSYPLEP